MEDGIEIKGLLYFGKDLHKKTDNSVPTILIFKYLLKKEVLISTL